MDMNMYITIAGTKHYHGLKVFDIGQELYLQKEPDNKYDNEAIKVSIKAITVIQTNQENGDNITAKIPHFETVGYVANSTNTVYKGTMSAGRLYDKVPRKFTATVLFITHTSVIAKVNSDVENLIDEMISDTQRLLEDGNSFFNELFSEDDEDIDFDEVISDEDFLPYPYDDEDNDDDE